MAYQRWADARELPGFSYDPQHMDGLTFCNDLEKPVFEKFPILAELKRWLGKQPEVAVAMMSGSGSTMFAVLKDAKRDEAGTVDPDGLAAKLIRSFGRRRAAHVGADECRAAIFAAVL